MRKYLSLAAALLSVQFLVAPAAIGHEGHDHGAPTPPVSTTVAPRMEASSGDFELVAIARPDGIAMYLDTFRENAPVPEAEIEVDAAGKILKAEPAGDGSYVIKPDWVGTPGDHDLAVTIQANGLIDILTGTLTIPPAPPAAKPPEQFLSGFVSPALASAVEDRLRNADTGLWVIAGGAFAAGVLVALLFRRRKAVGAVALLAAGTLLMNDPAFAAGTSEAAPAAVRDLAQRLPDGTVFVPKPTQRVLAIRTLFSEEQSHPGIVELPGRVIPDPNASGYVQSSMGGRLMPPDGGFPRLGTKVEAGQVLAVVLPASAPPISTASRRSCGRWSRKSR